MKQVIGKKGKKTDYVSRQYIGNLGKVENGIVAVTAYGLIEGMTVILASSQRELMHVLSK